MNRCQSCGISFTLAGCPVCNGTADPGICQAPSRGELNALEVISLVLRQPSSFFRELISRVSLSTALALGISAHWLGEIGDMLTLSLISERVSHFLEKLINLVTERVSESAFSPQMLKAFHISLNPSMDLEKIALVPVWSLFSLVFSALVIRLNIWFLRTFFRFTMTKLEYSEILKIFSIASLPYALKLIPIPGSGVIGGSWAIILMLIGYSETLQVSRFKSFLVLSLPILVVLGLVFSVLTIPLLVAISRF